MKTPALPLEEAQARLLDLAQPLPIEHVDLDGAIGRYLAEPLAARRMQPAADLSAMDGYAMIASDGAGPWKVVGESAAGHPYAGPLGRGQAVRISTGAMMPAAAGIVILQENVRRDGDTVMLVEDPSGPPDRHIRRRGIDFMWGAEVLAAGIRIGPAQAALAMAAGHSHVAVRRRPHVTVIDSGDELAVDLDACGVHQVPASNGLMLCAMARGLCCEVSRIGPVPDDRDAVVNALRLAEQADLIVTSGGASVGDHDLIRPALDAWGAKVDFWRVAIKPGKPILVATRRRQLILGLPGNPVSSYVTAYLFLLPLLRRLLGAARPLPRRIRTPLAGPLSRGGSRREFVRAWWDGERIAPHPMQDSGALVPLAASNAVIDRAAGAESCAAGETVEAYLLDNGGNA